MTDCVRSYFEVHDDYAARTATQSRINQGSLSEEKGVFQKRRIAGLLKNFKWEILVEDVERDVSTRASGGLHMYGTLAYSRLKLASGITQPASVLMQRFEHLYQ